jgi:hypothetical protein
LIATGHNDLHRHARRFAALAGFEETRDIEDQLGVNVRAAEKMARLHDALLDSGYEGHALEVYLVRLLFCLFADATGIFPAQAFLNYVQNSREDGGDLSARMAELFEILDTPDEAREKKKLLPPGLMQFRYIDGGLFGAHVPSAQFDARMRGALLDCCRFDWGGISPAIFGAMFQGVMDKGQRRELGAHYTSEENIMRLIDPLFMDALRGEFKKAKNDIRALDRLHDKIAGLKFLDPACGCGNFLMIAYRELRLLEIDVLKARRALLNGGAPKGADRRVPRALRGNGHPMLDIETALKVGVAQFYGIEILPWPCQIARAGLWLMDHLMNIKASEEFGQYYVRLPLAHGATIAEANALRVDWGSVLPKGEAAYVMGNPPFSGARLMGQSQKADMALVFGDTKGAGNLDYVAAWYRKAADYMEGTPVRAAFVSTNSIAQGEQPAVLWRPLIGRGAAINFGEPAFKWSSEARGRAAVHCVIVGFSFQRTKADLNPYLVKGPTVFVERRRTPLCDAPEMSVGSQVIDDGNLTIEADEYDGFVAKEPRVAPFIRRLVGAEEFINDRKRWCLWLAGVPPKELRGMPLVKERVESCRKFRVASKRATTRKGADTPSLFCQIAQPDADFLLVPRVSSEHRMYVPMGFLPPDVIATDAALTIPGATLYHFGVLTSKVHMAWVRRVCGMLEVSYRYSKDVVYNNFPWPAATEKQRARVEELAQAVLDARALYRGNSLADLYDPAATPPELTKAHRALDAAVMRLYGYRAGMDEAEGVADLMGRYAGLAAGGG